MPELVRRKHPLEKYLGNFYACSPLVYGDLVIVSAGKEAKGGLRALNKDTGQEVWSHGNCDSRIASPTLAKIRGWDQVIYRISS